MVEREQVDEFYGDKIKDFAQTLAGWDQRIIEIAVFESLENESQNHNGLLNLVCTFDPEPVSDNSGYISVMNLMIRDDLEGVSERLGIPYSIDLSFKLGGKVYLPAGEIIDKTEDGVILWSKNNHEGEGIK